MDPLIAVIALILIVVVVILVVARRPQPQTRPLVSRTPDVIVDAEHAQLIPYPYVMVNDDGSVRELTPAERKPLEMAFSPFDGGRPYTKTTYADRTPGGHRGGYLQRSQVPKGTPIQPA